MCDLQVQAVENNRNERETDFVERQKDFDEELLVLLLERQSETVDDRTKNLAEAAGAYVMLYEQS
mgnify:CR=1 FL=1